LIDNRIDDRVKLLSPPKKVDNMLNW